MGNISLDTIFNEVRLVRSEITQLVKPIAEQQNEHGQEIVRLQIKVSTLEADKIVATKKMDDMKTEIDERRGASKTLPAVAIVISIASGLLALAQFIHH